jgi:hypothetical protein
MPAQPLTPEQKADAARLRALFKKWQTKQRASGKKASQEAASEALDFGQSAFNQYLNGRIPLNPDAAIKIANLIDCRVEDFSQQLAEQIAGYASAAPAAALVSSRHAESGNAPDDVSADEMIELLILYQQADSATKRIVRESLQQSASRKPARWGRVADN